MPRWLLVALVASLALIAVLGGVWLVVPQARSDATNAVSVRQSLLAVSA